MLVLILDANTALLGAKEGLTLCIQTVIPALFPFFVLSVMLTSSMTGLSVPAFRPLGRLCKIPHGSEILLLTGFLGGYPVGAQAVAQAWKAGQLTRSDARRMLGFCSNAGPAFLFGIIAPQFADPKAGWLLWGIHIAAALTVAVCIPVKSKTERACIPKGDAITLPAALDRALRITASVCGWVTVFRIVLVFLRRWFLWLLPRAVQIILMGIFELTNGCCQLSAIASEKIRFIVCAGILSFGGLCVTMQTCSATGKLGLGYYLPGKLLQSAISAFLAFLICYFGAYAVLFCAIAIFAAYIFAFLRQKTKKTVAIPG